MPRIERQPEAFADDAYDLIVVGGGVYGATLAYEAARRGLRPLMLEMNDFGSGVSANSLRIVHGGLRYLQSMDLRRHRESVAERRWHLRQFPDLVVPLRCLMPLYGKGLKRPSTFRLALMLNDLLSCRRNKGVRGDRRLLPGRIAGIDEVAQAFPLVRKGGLQGGAVWHDAVMLSSERVLMEALRLAVAHGARLLNYTRAVSLEQSDGRVTGVRALDEESGREYVYRSARVINCAGPWCRSLAAGFDRDLPALFRKSLAFNLLLDRACVSGCAVAVEPPRADAGAYFIVPWKGRVLAGTRHIPWAGGTDAPSPPDAEIDRFIDDLNTAMPGFEADGSQVRRVYAGLLPATGDGSDQTTHAPVFHDHGRHGGPAGLLSVSGVKWTTARDVAERSLRLAFSPLNPVQPSAAAPEPFEPALLSDAGPAVDDPAAFGVVCDRLIRDESVLQLDDLLLRRMDGLDSDESAVRAAAIGVRAMRRAGIVPDLDRLVRAMSARRDGAADALGQWVADSSLDEEEPDGSTITPRRTGTA